MTTRFEVSWLRRNMPGTARQIPVCRYHQHWSVGACHPCRPGNLCLDRCQPGPPSCPASCVGEGSRCPRMPQMAQSGPCWIGWTWASGAGNLCLHRPTHRRRSGPPVSPPALHCRMLLLESRDPSLQKFPSALDLQMGRQRVTLLLPIRYRLYRWLELSKRRSQRFCLPEYPLDISGSYNAEYRNACQTAISLIRIVALPRLQSLTSGQLKSYRAPLSPSQ
jgi:hypothetical protein